MARPLLRRQGSRRKASAAPRRVAVPADGMEHAATNPLRHHGHLRRDGPRDRPAVGQELHVGTGGRQRDRPQPDQHSRSLSPGGGKRRQADGICGRHSSESRVAAPRRVRSGKPVRPIRRFPESGPLSGTTATAPRSGSITRRKMPNAVPDGPAHGIRKATCPSDDGSNDSEPTGSGSRAP